MSRKLVVLPSVLLVAVLGLACDDGSPTAPSRLPPPVVSQPPQPTPPPTPSPAPDLSGLVGVWNLTVRVTAVSGNGCVADTMRSQVGVPANYSLSITQNYNLEVTLRSESGDRACTFTPLADSTGFTTYGQGGYYTCEQWLLIFRCTDGTQHAIFTYGEDISGRLSGTEMNGTWDAVWFEEFGEGVEMKAQFTGIR